MEPNLFPHSTTMGCLGAGFRGFIDGKQMYNDNNNGERECETHIRVWQIHEHDDGGAKGERIMMTMGYGFGFGCTDLVHG